MHAATWKIALIMVLAVTALSVGETLIARGMKQAGETTGWWPAARAALTNAWVVAGALVLALHLALYAAALAKADLSLVMPLTAASYPLGTVLARVFLHEQVHPARWVGTVIITVGVAIVAWGETRS